MNRTRVTCSHREPPPADLTAWESAWHDLPGLELTQAWQEKPEPGFLPGLIKTAWSPQGWHVLAVLQDRDIANTTRNHRDPSWETGDVLEVFLRPEGQDSYYEIHLTPENFGIRLRLPGGDFQRHMNRLYTPRFDWVFDHLHTPEGLTTITRVEPERGRWLAGMTLPFTPVLENGDSSTPVHPWLVSFCRYDTTRGNPNPVLSSTSRLQILKFHEQSQWSLLQFAPP